MDNQAQVIVWWLQGFTAHGVTQALRKSVLWAAQVQVLQKQIPAVWVLHASPEPLAPHHTNTAAEPA